MKEKKAVYVFLGFSLSIIIIFLSVLYAYDPLQIFHKTWREKQTFSKNMRLQAAGILNNYHYDSIILGTSMLENTSSNEASQILGGNFINISMPASSPYVRSFVMKYALKRTNIKKIIYSFDTQQIVSNKKERKKYKVESYDFLYDEWWINDFKAYMNDKYIKCLLSFSDSAECIGVASDLDRPNAWYKSSRDRFGGLDKWFEAKNNRQIKLAFKSISDTAKKVKKGESKPYKGNIGRQTSYIDEYLLSTVKQNPTTEFIIVVPPYSRIRFAEWAQYDLKYFEIHKELIKYLAHMDKTYTNLKLFAWGDYDFLDDIKNYKDTGHYEYKINSWMLNAIGQNEGLINSSNVDEYLEIITNKALSYDLVSLGKKIDIYLTKSKKL